MFFGLFDTYATTCSPSNLKGKLHPLVCVELQSTIFEKIKQYMNENNYLEQEINEEYFDLFGVKDGFEVSFIVSRNEGRTIIEMNVYGENKRGKVKRKLKEIYADIAQYLNINLSRGDY